MRAHDDMGKPGMNLVYDDVKKAAEANGKTVDETLERSRRQPPRTAAITWPSTPRRAESSAPFPVRCPPDGP
jgi:hypothetical protein